jgi:hypothetical protein
MVPKSNRFSSTAERNNMDQLDTASQQSSPLSSSPGRLPSSACTADATNTGSNTATRSNTQTSADIPGGRTATSQQECLHTASSNKEADELAKSSTPKIRWPLTEDALLIEIDVERHCMRDAVCEVGVAAIDAARLPTFSKHTYTTGMTGDRYSKAANSIGAVTFDMKDNKHCRGRGVRHSYWCKVGYAEDFKFGKVHSISLAAAKFKIVDHIRTLLGDPPKNKVPTSNYNNTKKVVFLFFSKVNDIRWLASLGIVLQNEFPNSEIGDLQTESIAATIARSKGKNLCGAKDVYESLGFAVDGLHCGGNDAFYQLRAHLASLVLTEEQTQTLDSRGTIAPPLQLVRPAARPAAVPARRVARANADDAGLVLELTRFNLKDGATKESTMAGNTILNSNKESQEIVPKEQVGKDITPPGGW